ncbi:serine hydrolase [Actinomycetes bacterium KLBMP 9759]
MLLVMVVAVQRAPARADDPVADEPAPTRVQAPPAAAAVPVPLTPASGTAGKVVASVPASAGLVVAVLDRVTGERALGPGATEPVYTASLVKLVVAVDILDRSRSAGSRIDDGDRDLLRRALSRSDDAAMNQLWVQFDGVGAPARVSAALGLTATTAPRDPSQWGESRASAADLLVVVDHVLTGMAPDDRALVLGDLRDATPTAADGFGQDYGLLDARASGEGPPVLAKQGWMCCVSGERYLHSIGAVGADQRFVVALLSTRPRGTGWDAARAELNSAARTVLAGVDGGRADGPGRNPWFRNGPLGCATSIPASVASRP